MKSVIILSDTHENRNILNKLQTVLKEADMIIHLGDGYRDALYIGGKFNNNIISIKGNCDGVLDDQKIIEIEGVKFLAVHGCNHGVKHSLEKLCEEAKKQGVDYALFGHTHKATNEKIDGVTLFNPGSLNYFEFDKSYGYMTIINGKVLLKIVKIDL